MVFDPTRPADHADIISSELRNQFNALNDKIDAQQATINSLQTTVAAQAATIQSQQAQAQGTMETLAELQEAVDALQGG